MSIDDKRPPDIVTFSQPELDQNQKTINQIFKMFCQNHPEIMAPGNSDLTKMIRDEKQMYANVAISFAVNFLAALEKKKKA